MLALEIESVAVIFPYEIVLGILFVLFKAL